MVRSKDSSASHLDGNGGVNQTDMGRVARQEVWLPVALLFAMSGDVVCSLPPITLSRIQARKEATERHIRGGRVDEMHMRWIQLSQCVATD